MRLKKYMTHVKIETRVVEIKVMRPLIINNTQTASSYVNGRGLDKVKRNWFSIDTTNVKVAHQM